MKKEIKNLLAQDNGEWKINEAFKLVRWTLKPEEDITGRSGEYLKLEMIPVNDGRHNYFSKMIDARDVQGIIDEVAAAMYDIMEQYTRQIVNKWKGGLL